MEGAWLRHALPLTTFTCEAIFAIEPSFYIGPENGIGALSWEAVHEPLPPVTLQRQFANCVTTAELLGRETAVIDHYRQVVALAKRYGKTASLQPFPYFRSKPAIIAGGDMITEFAWNDDLNETKTVLQALVDAGVGEDRIEYFDVDQGWEILIVAMASTTCWIEWDAEGPPPKTGGYSINRVEAASQAAVAMGRMRVIHDRLVEALGRDYWTCHSADRAPAL